MPWLCLATDVHPLGVHYVGHIVMVSVHQVNSMAKKNKQVNIWFKQQILPGSILPWFWCFLSIGLVSLYPANSAAIFDDFTVSLDCIEWCCYVPLYNSLKLSCIGCLYSSQMNSECLGWYIYHCICCMPDIIWIACNPLNSAHIHNCVVAIALHQ